MTGVGALGDGAGGKVVGIGTAVGGEVTLESSPRPVVNCHGVPRIACTASALYCSPTGRRLIVRINFTPVAVPMMFSSVASERPSHTPLLDEQDTRVRRAGGNSMAGGERTIRQADSWFDGREFRRKGNQQFSSTSPARIHARDGEPRYCRGGECLERRSSRDGVSSREVGTRCATRK